MYLLSFLQCTKCTVVCDQIANQSFVLRKASILGQYRKKFSLRSASHARRQNSVTGGGGGRGISKFFLGGHENFNTSNPRVWTKKKVFISKYARIFTNSGVKTKNSFSSQKMRVFSRIPGETTKKRVIIAKSVKKQFLLTNSGVITSILGA